MTSRPLTPPPHLNQGDHPAALPERAHARGAAPSLHLNQRAPAAGHRTRIRIQEHLS